MTDPAPAPAAGRRLEKLLAMLRTAPDDAFCLYGVAQEYAKQGRHADAVEWFDKAIMADANGAYSYYHKARSQQALEQEPAAAVTLRAGLAAARRSGDSHATSELMGFLSELGEEP